MSTEIAIDDNTVIVQGSALDVLRSLPAECVQCCVTSPPYWGLRDYGVDGQLGLEPTPEEYVARMVGVFREVRRVLREDGTLWLNLGDSYGKKKQLVGAPWRVALALQSDGWVLRQDIVWHKPNPMPAPVTDRCVSAHEYVFLLAKSERYHYDAEAVKEPAVSPRREKTPLRSTGDAERLFGRGTTASRFRTMGTAGVAADGMRLRRSVWSISAKPYRGAHFATMPPDLARTCVLAGSRPGDVVLDPFNGAGTTGIVAREHGRAYVGIELNPEYVNLTQQRFAALKTEAGA